MLKRDGEGRERGGRWGPRRARHDGKVGPTWRGVARTAKVGEGGSVRGCATAVVTGQAHAGGVGRGRAERALERWGMAGDIIVVMCRIYIWTRRPRDIYMRWIQIGRKFK